MQKEREDSLVGMKVLVVEDNAVELFENSRQGTFDVILMDMHMPVMGGVEATKRIRAMAHADAQTIPILALTANDFEEDIRQTREAGMNDHLTKPFDMEKIFGALAAYAKRI